MKYVSMKEAKTILVKKFMFLVGSILIITVFGVWVVS